MSKRRLQLMEDLEPILGTESTPKAPLPERFQVLYVGPTPDGKPKNCSNCCLWNASNRCLIHSPKIDVTPQMVCGYWVGGTPTEDRFYLADVQYVEPKFSGLATFKYGASCSTCRWFEEVSLDRGCCHALQEKGKPPPVHPLGCCARFDEVTE